MTPRTSTKFLRPALALLAAGLALPPMASAEDAKAPKPLRALYVAGGCCHDYNAQRKIIPEGISSRARVEWTVAYDPDRTTAHKNPVYDDPNWAKGFDVVVHDECSSDVKEMAVVETVLRPHQDGLPAVVLHCGMHSYRTPGWDKKVATPWMQLTGLITTGHGPQEPIAITFLDRRHPITRPLADWTTIKEELYNNAAGAIEPTAHALARGKQSFMVYPRVNGKADTKAGKENTAEAVVAWTNTYQGKTRVFATTLGHNNETAADARYLDLVTRGLLWACDKLDDEGKPREGYAVSAQK